MVHHLYHVRDLFILIWLHKPFSKVPLNGNMKLLLLIWAKSCLLDLLLNLCKVMYSQKYLILVISGNVRVLGHKYKFSVFCNEVPAEVKSSIDCGMTSLLKSTVGIILYDRFYPSTLVSPFAKVVGLLKLFICSMNQSEHWSFSL